MDAQFAGRLPTCIVGVISSRASAVGLARAQAAGIPTACIEPAGFTDRSAFDAALSEQIEAWQADWVVLAGFMRILTPAFTARYAGKLLNIHPSLLPRHPGLHTHAAALAAGDLEHGATVHFVTEALDGGPRIIQGTLSVQPHDDPSSLADKVMVDIEQRIYPQALAWAVAGRLQMKGPDTVTFNGQPLTAPLTLAHLEPGF